MDDLLGDWRTENPEHTSDVRVVGHRWSERSHELKTFLARNHVPYRWYDVERDDEARRLTGLAEAGPEELPLRAGAGRRHAALPFSTLLLADALGLRTRGPAALRRVHRGRWSCRARGRGVRRLGGAAAP